MDFITTPFHKNIDREFQGTNSKFKLTRYRTLMCSICDTTSTCTEFSDKAPFIVKHAIDALVTSEV